MYNVRIVENHGHNGDEISVYKFANYDDAWRYVRDFYFDGDVTEMLSAEENENEWYCEEADARITIE